MRIRIERRGGLAGRPAVGERDESELTAEQRSALHQLLRTPVPSAPAAGADRFHYRIIIEDQGRTRELDVPEDAMPDALADIPKLTL
jgi:hypothetical protein